VLALHCQYCRYALRPDIAPFLAWTAHHAKSHRYTVSCKLHLAVSTYKSVNVRHAVIADS